MHGVNSLAVGAGVHFHPLLTCYVPPDLANEWVCASGRGGPGDLVLVGGWGSWLIHLTPLRTVLP